MKTREQLRDCVDATIQQWHDWSQTHLPSDGKRELATRIVNLLAEIQRDAREGMVPAEDLKPLLLGLEIFAASLPQLGNKWDTLRAKHPNLFTK